MSNDYLLMLNHFEYPSSFLRYKSNRTKKRQKIRKRNFCFMYRKLLRYAKQRSWILFYFRVFLCSVCIIGFFCSMNFALTDLQSLLECGAPKDFVFATLCFLWSYLIKFHRS